MENKSKQIDLSYTYNYSVAEVFEAWTNPKYLPRWYAPHGCTVEYKKLEIRVGGKFHFCIHSPGFGDCWVIGTYLEIVPKKKIVYTTINADENGTPIDPTKIGMHPDWPRETTVTVTFSETDGKTTINLKQNAPEDVAKKSGAYHSWLEMFENMETFIQEEITH
jgi:uncharacterized protein YndB with AHSA1/START domain